MQRNEGEDLLTNRKKRKEKRGNAKENNVKVNKNLLGDA